VERGAALKARFCPFELDVQAQSLFLGTLIDSKLKKGKAELNRNVETRGAAS
jgi:hypothetical protein